MKKVTVLTGSPRKGGNSDRMAEAFIAGALSAGHSVHKIEAAQLSISGCKACDGCWMNGRPCVQEDDFNRIAPLILDADVVVFASPLYYYDLSSQLKTLLDRFYALCEDQSGKPMKIREYVLMMYGETSHKEDFEAVSRIMGEIAHFLKWEHRGSLFATSAAKKGDVTDAVLKEAERIGQEL